MKKVSILIPCYNEEENVVPISEEIVNLFLDKLSSYDYELVFIDNCSVDNTRVLLRKICSENERIRVIFNVRNFGQFNSPFYGMCQTSGDCVISMCADFQDPVEMIPVFLEEWERGYKIVSGIKTSSKENKFVRMLRTIYYKMIRKISRIEFIEHFTGFGLYDKSFIDILRKLNDPVPFLRGIVAELGYKRKEIPYVQPKRRFGTTHNNFFSLFDAAMLSFTSYTKLGLRIATMTGFFVALLTIIIALIYFIYKLVFWETFQAGIAPIIIGIFFIGSLQLFFIGLVGEYVITMNIRLMNRPLVIEEERINF